MNRIASVFAGLVLAGTGLAFAGSDYYPPEALHVEKGGALNLGDACKPTERPLLRQSRALKMKLMTDTGIDWKDAGKYELDHIIPLCLGGAPVDPKNLQLQRCYERRGPACLSGPAADKDKLERKICRQVRRGEITCQKAREILTGS